MALGIDDRSETGSHRHEIDRCFALGGLSGSANIILKIGVADVPTIHRPRQVSAIGVPIEDIESVRLPPLEVVANDVRPDQIIPAQCREDESKFATWIWGNRRGDVGVHRWARCSAGAGAPA
jgi:hypothetical protein